MQTKRTKKATVYFTPEMYEDGQDLARIDGVTWPEYVVKLVGRDIENRSDKLRAFREIRSE